MAPSRNELLVPLAIRHRGTTDGEGMKLWLSWLAATIRFEGSDLIVKTGIRPRIRHRGVLKDLETAVCNADEMFQVAKDILDPNQLDYLARNGSIDFAYDYGDRAAAATDTIVRRFRVNLFMARGTPSLAARLITSQIKKFEELYLPSILGDVSMAAQGLILFSGVTGSGKSTSIASMIQYVNERKKVHIITIEDPIEYIFNDAKATINQREIGIDATNFNDALRALVRENPDVVLVGEMRDYETFEAAIRAAETGHLVFGTIHASSAWQTFGRIYDLFPENER